MTINRTFCLHRMAVDSVFKSSDGDRSSRRTVKVFSGRMRRQYLMVFGHQRE